MSVGHVGVQGGDIDGDKQEIGGWGKEHMMARNVKCVKVGTMY